MLMKDFIIKVFFLKKVVFIFESEKKHKVLTKKGEKLKVYCYKRSLTHTQSTDSNSSFHFKKTVKPFGIRRLPALFSDY